MKNMDPRNIIIGVLASILVMVVVALSIPLLNDAATTAHLTNRISMLEYALGAAGISAGQVLYSEDGEDLNGDSDLTFDGYTLYTGNLSVTEGVGTGDMLKSTYDVGEDGTVDDSEGLSGVSWGTVDEDIVTSGNVTASALIGSVYLSDIKTDGTAGETMLEGNYCFQHTDGKWYRSDADVTANCTKRMAMAMADASADDTIEFLEYGYITNTDWTVTMGSILYASTSTGNFTETAPSGSGDIVRVVGYGTDNANKIKVDIDKSWVELE